MQVIEGIIFLASVLSILFYLLHLIGLYRIPAHGRAKTPTMDRFGRALPPSRNPGYKETEDEREG